MDEKQTKKFFQNKKIIYNIKGDIIFPQGTEADGAYIVISGSTLKKHHQKGKMIEHVTGLLKGDTFLVPGMFFLNQT